MKLPNVGIAAARSSSELWTAPNSSTVHIELIRSRRDESRVVKGGRYVVTATFQRGSDVIAAGATVFVLYAAGDSYVDIAARSRAGEVIQRRATITDVASFRIRTVDETRCPSVVWRWARTARHECAELQTACKLMRASAISAAR